MHLFVNLLKMCYSAKEVIEMIKKSTVLLVCVLATYALVANAEDDRPWYECIGTTGVLTNCSPAAYHLPMLPAPVDEPIVNPDYEGTIYSSALLAAATVAAFVFPHPIGTLAGVTLGAESIWVSHCFYSRPPAYTRIPSRLRRLAGRSAAIWHDD